MRLVIRVLSQVGDESTPLIKEVPQFGERGAAWTFVGLLCFLRSRLHWPQWNIDRSGDEPAVWGNSNGAKLDFRSPVATDRQQERRNCIRGSTARMLANTMNSEEGNRLMASLTALRIRFVFAAPFCRRRVGVMIHVRNRVAAAMGNRKRFSSCAADIRSEDSQSQ
jgi:hypothetical protein